MDIRVGHVVKCERKEGADKLLRLTVDFGEDGERTILSSLYPIYEPDFFQGNKFIFIINLEPRKFMGELSHGMILCADGEKPIPLVPKEDIPAGSKIL
jgi:methionine--tRNA ligase beta chain